MKITLTPKLKQDLELGHRKVRECDQIKAILSVMKRGSVRQIFQALHQHQSLNSGAVFTQ